MTSSSTIVGMTLDVTWKISLLLLKEDNNVNER